MKKNIEFNAAKIPKYSPAVIIQMILQRHVQGRVAEVISTISFPKGQRTKHPILNAWIPNGIPMIVAQ